MLSPGEDCFSCPPRSLVVCSSLYGAEACKHPSLSTLTYFWCGRASLFLRPQGLLRTQWSLLMLLNRSRLKIRINFSHENAEGITGWRCRSVVEHFVTMCGPLTGAPSKHMPQHIPSTTHTKPTTHKDSSTFIHFKK